MPQKCSLEAGPEAPLRQSGTYLTVTTAVREAADSEWLSYCRTASHYGATSSSTCDPISWGNMSAYATAGTKTDGLSCPSRYEECESPMRRR
jgi:hypothetical protein